MTTLRAAHTALVTQSMKIRIATFNTHGLSKPTKQATLAGDMRRYNIDVACLQETKVTEHIDEQLGDYRLILIPGDCRHYGHGFAIAKHLQASLVEYHRVSDRIAKAKFHLGNDGILVLINAYAPTQARSDANEQERDEFYEQLSAEVALHSTCRTTLFIAGDFNAKIGQRTGEEECMGVFSRGRRNTNGQRLIEFCEENSLKIANSLFRHRACHTTTWQGARKDGDITVPIYNQIDFILVKDKHRRYITDARSYAGMQTNSDHRMVVMSTSIGDWPRREKIHNRPIKYDTTKLTQDLAHREKYKNTYDELRTRYTNTEQTGPHDKLCEIQKIVATAATTSIGVVKQTRNKLGIPELDTLSMEQKELRLKMNNASQPEQRERYRQERNRVLHNIRKLVNSTTARRLDELASEIERAKDNAQMFQAARNLTRSKPIRIIVQKEGGDVIANKSEAANTIGKYFETKLFDPTIPPLPSARGSLSEPITMIEVKRAAERLNNGKAAGPDNIPGELLKYGSESLHQDLADILNESFVHDEDLSLGDGSLIVLQKPGKPRGPLSNLRPIVLFTALRKVLSTITLHRVRGKIETFLPPGQSGFRSNRSTADAVWAHKWLAATAQRRQVEIEILGIDMTSAFDTIDRGKLMENTRGIFGTDAWRMTLKLLTNTRLTVRLENAQSKPFTTNTGSPQGDSLSPILFTVYLECAMRELRARLIRPDIDRGLPPEIGYADDQDFISRSADFINKIEKEATSSLANWSLKVNPTKTERTVLKKKREGDGNEETWRKTKKLGTLLGDNEELKRRKSLAAHALTKTSNLWSRNAFVSEQRRLRVYNACVKPILAYNMGTWALSQNETTRLDCFHRKQLRRVLGIHYPDIISNQELYQRTGSEPLSEEMYRARWRLFGHVLRMTEEVPAKQAMIYFFTCPEANGVRGRPSTTLPIKISQDLKDIHKEASHRRGRKKATIVSLPAELTKLADLKKLEQIARDRKMWQQTIIDTHALLSERGKENKK